MRRVIPGHTLWDRLVACGLENRLRAIADDPCTPDIIGVNHYLSSERLLDHQVERHSGRDPADRALGECDGVVHVDVDAVRNLPDAVIGLAGLVEQAWERYRIPVAVTECHLGSTRDDQARWFIEVWRDTERLRSRGVDVRAVTAWSLLGAYDWNHMVTRFIGHYEPGVFDVRSGTPKPTLMSRVLKDLAAGRRPAGPGLEVPGWWRARRGNPGGFAVRADDAEARAESLLIVDGHNVLTRLAVDACEARGLHYMLAKDLAFESLPARTWAALDARVQGPGGQADLVRLCKAAGINGAFFTNEGHIADHSAAPRLLCVAHGPVFTAHDETTFPGRLLDALDADRSIAIEPGEVWRGVYGPSLIDGVLDLLLDGATGRKRFMPAERWTHAEFACALAEAAGHGRVAGAETGGELNTFGEPDTPCSHLPPAETMLERFVLDRRLARRATERRFPPKNRERYLEAAE